MALPPQRQRRRRGALQLAAVACLSVAVVFYCDDGSGADISSNAIKDHGLATLRRSLSSTTLADSKEGDIITKALNSFGQTK